MDAELTKNQKILKGVVIGLGILIVVLLMVIVGTIVYRLGAPGDGVAEPVLDSAAPPATFDVESGLLDLPLPGDAEIVDVQLDGRYLLVWARTGGFEQRFYVIDLATNERVRTLRHGGDAP